MFHLLAPPTGCTRSTQYLRMRVVRGGEVQQPAPLGEAACAPLGAEVGNRGRVGRRWGLGQRVRGIVAIVYGVHHSNNLSAARRAGNFLRRVYVSTGTWGSYPLVRATHFSDPSRAGRHRIQLVWMRNLTPRPRYCALWDCSDVLPAVGPHFPLPRGWSASWRPQRKAGPGVMRNHYMHRVALLPDIVYVGYGGDQHVAGWWRLFNPSIKFFQHLSFGVHVIKGVNVSARLEERDRFAVLGFGLLVSSNMEDRQYVLNPLPLGSEVAVVREECCHLGPLEMSPPTQTLPCSLLIFCKVSFGLVKLL